MVDTPLEAAIKFLIPLQNLSHNLVETHILAYEIYSRKGRVLLMLQSIKRGYAVDSTCAALHTCLVRFHCHVTQHRADYSHTVNTVLNTEMHKLYKDKTTYTLNEEFLLNNSNSHTHLYHGSIMKYEIDNSQQKEAIALATQLGKEIQNITIQTCTCVLRSLSCGDYGELTGEEASDYARACRERFPLARAFRLTPTTNHVTQENHDVSQ